MVGDPGEARVAEGRGAEEGREVTWEGREVTWEVKGVMWEGGRVADREV